jgi:hypothetical protein
VFKIHRAASAALLIVAAASAALSYAHLRALAEAHGQAGWQAHVLPVTVDGLEAIATMTLIDLRLRGEKGSVLPWLMLAAGIAASLGGNVLSAGTDPLNCAVAGWPALALMGSVKMLVVMLEPKATSPAARPAASRTTKPAEPAAKPRARTARGGKPSGNPEVLAWIAQYRAEHGREPTGTEIGERFSFSKRRGNQIKKLAFAQPVAA